MVHSRTVIRVSDPELVVDTAPPKPWGVGAFATTPGLLLVSLGPGSDGVCEGCEGSKGGREGGREGGRGEGREREGERVGAH